jgi:hypothetical protein
MIMMHTELEWFRDVQSAPDTSPFQCVLAGHLRLCRALFTCEGMDKKKYGQVLKSKVAIAVKLSKWIKIELPV